MSNDVSIATAKQIVDWIVSNIEVSHCDHSMHEIDKKIALYYLQNMFT